MRLTRRTLVRLAATSAIAPLLPGCPSAPTDDSGGPAPTPERSPEPSPWAAPGSDDPATFPSGLRVGDATAEAAVIRLRTSAPGVELVVMEADGDGWVELDRFALTPVDGTAGVLLEGLVPDTAYAIAAYADAERRTPVVRLRTAATTTRVVRFGATSCLGDANPDLPCLDSVAADALDAFLLLGDTVYADAATTEAEYLGFYDVVGARPSFRAATASTSLVATWDDHEVDNNWSSATTSADRVEAALAAFRAFLPQGGGPTGGIWRALSWGPAVDLFVLDCRSERRDGHYVSPEQMAWLKEGLRASTARFKLLLNSVPITDLTPLFDQVEIEDRWDGYPEDRAEILSFIRDEAIGGVLWITGDVHFAAITTVDPPGGVAAGQHEVFVGPAGSFPNVLVDYYPLDEQFLWLSSAWNWVRFTCDPGLGTIRVEHVDSSGAVLHDLTLAV